MGIEDEIRPGLAGYSDRFAGPRPSAIETAGTLAAVAAAAAWADRDPRGSTTLSAQGLC